MNIGQVGAAGWDRPYIDFLAIFVLTEWDTKKFIWGKRG